MSATNTNSVRAEAARLALDLMRTDANRAAVADVNPTALRNLVRAAAAADCVEEMEILVYYQERRKVIKKPAADLVRTVIERSQKPGKDQPDLARQFVHLVLADLARLRPDRQPGAQGQGGQSGGQDRGHGQGDRGTGSGGKGGPGRDGRDRGGPQGGRR